MFAKQRTKKYTYVNVCKNFQRKKGFLWIKWINLIGSDRSESDLSIWKFLATKSTYVKGKIIFCKALHILAFTGGRCLPGRLRYILLIWQPSNDAVYRITLHSVRQTSDFYGNIFSIFSAIFWSIFFGFFAWSTFLNLDLILHTQLL